jgi:hypothetical protein
MPILDGRMKFGCDIDTFYKKPEIAAMLARRGVLRPPLPEDIATHAAPAVAFVEPYQGVARWIARCPDCTGAEYVWADTPRFLCAQCANRGIGHLWRRVEMPADRRRIERMLNARADPETRVWYPHENADQLAVENVMLNGGGG